MNTATTVTILATNYKVRVI